MIKTGRLKFSSTFLTIVVITLSSAGVISLSLYSDSRADYLYANRDQIYILMNSWHCLEHETLNLPAGPSADGDEKKWLYSLNTFGARLKNFLNSPQTKELAGENRLFEKKLNDIEQLWSTLGNTVKNSEFKVEDSKLRTINTMALLEEMSDIISDRIAEQTAHLRLAVFVLSMVIVISMVFFIVQMQRESHLISAWA